MNTSNVRDMMIRIVSDSCLEQERVALCRKITAAGESAVPVLLELLDNPNRITQNHAIRLLLYIDPDRFMEKALARLKSEDEGDRGTICYELAMHVPNGPDSQAVEPLCELLRHELSPDVRSWAVIALGQIGDKRALPTLEWVRDHDTGETWEGRRIASTAEAAIREITSAMA